MATWGAYMCMHMHADVSPFLGSGLSGRWCQNLSRCWEQSSRCPASQFWDGTNKGEPSKNGWQITSNRLCHRQRVEWQPFACSLLPPPPTHTVPACKILSETKTKEKTSVDVQSPSLRKNRGSVLHRETRTCYYQPKYQNLGQIVWGENTQLKLY